MTSKTKIQIVNDCFNELRISGITSQPDSEDVVIALARLEDMVSELPIDIGFSFESTPNPNSFSGIPSYANFAIVSSLAVRLATIYGKIPESLIRQASQSMSALISRVAIPRRVNYPSRQPLGMGNRRSNFFNNQFMPEIVNAPNSVNTEILNIGDKKHLSINFSSELLPSETISSYTTDISFGVSISGASTSVASIDFDVLATATGFQQILFKIIGSSGTTINRTINFNVVESTAIRGNP